MGSHEAAARLAPGALLERLRGRVVTVSAELGVFVVAPVERWIGRRSPVGDTPFYDPAQFPWVAELERHWTEIRDELEDVLADRAAIPAFQDISVDQVDLSDDDRWQTYFLFGYGFEVAEHTAACPRTTELVRTVPGMKTAMFSILAPGKHIPNHRGPYKGVLRHHLGLVVPEPAEACRIRVGDEIRHWTAGGSLLLDDTYDHEVWNDTDGERVVLFLDVVRPLTGVARHLNSVLLWLIAHSPLVRDARRRQERWTAQVAARRARTPA
ncbi:MAG TPA: aspartyl/asparaginyl beta-hydroxylase domain-containing protein [Solirubrobacteraceae bacterium]|jgi:beta-hydroxylase|nr:aspartyl/asparaginyl beta-hydroxylase domain-containing protein [Solirubrobacteraceae bacterium]